MNDKLHQRRAEIFPMYLWQVMKHVHRLFQHKITCSLPPANCHPATPRWTNPIPSPPRHCRVFPDRASICSSPGSCSEDQGRNNNGEKGWLIRILLSEDVGVPGGHTYSGWSRAGVWRTLALVMWVLARLCFSKDLTSLYPCHWCEDGLLRLRSERWRGPLGYARKHGTSCRPLSYPQGIEITDAETHQSTNNLKHHFSFLSEVNISSLKTFCARHFSQHWEYSRAWNKQNSWPHGVYVLVRGDR